MPELRIGAASWLEAFRIQTGSNYPVDTEEFEELRSSMEKLQLNDASLVFTPESSAALGFGFRCGYP